MVRFQFRIILVISLIVCTATLALTGGVAGTAAAESATAPQYSMAEQTETNETTDDTDSEESSSETNDETAENETTDTSNSSDDTDTQDPDDTDADNETDASPPYFAIESIESNSPIKAGERVNVTITVQNTGQETGTGDVWFKLDEFEKEKHELTLSPDETGSVTLHYVSQEDDAKEWTLTAATDDESVTDTYVIEEPGNDTESSSGSDRSSSRQRSSTSTDEATFEIESIETNTPIKANETLHVTITVTNTGDESEKRVWIARENRTLNDSTLALSADETKTMNLTYETDPTEHGNWSLGVHTPDDTATTAILIEELVPILEITGIETNAPIQSGEELEANVTVRNTGDIGTETDIWLEFEDHLVDERTVNISRNQTEPVTLSYHSPDGLTGSWTLTANTVADQWNTTIAVTDPSTDQQSQTTTPHATSDTGEDGGAATETQIDASMLSDRSSVGVGMLLTALLGLGILVGRQFI